MEPSSPKTPRRRHVTSRDRAGCVTCRRRHRRCDKKRPGCLTCANAGYTCEGYVANRITFRDQTLQVQRKYGAVDGDEIKRQPTRSPAKTPDRTPDRTSARTWTTTPSRSPTLLIDDAPLATSAQDPMTAWWDVDFELPLDLDLLFVPPPLLPPLDCLPLVLPHPIYAHALFADDVPRLQRLFDADALPGLAALLPLPLADLLADATLGSPALHQATLALTALDTADGEPQATHQALCHYAAALSTVHAATGLTTDHVPTCLARLLLANAALRLGALAAWRAHLRAAGRILGTHYALFAPPAASPIALAFARMALLVELEDDDRSVTDARTMPPAVATALAARVGCWSSRLSLTPSAAAAAAATPRDRLLVLVRAVAHVELQWRRHPQRARMWARRMAAIDSALVAWRAALPDDAVPHDRGPTELPSRVFDCDDCPLCCPGGLAARASPKPPPLLTPLLCASSAAAAPVDYAHYLCARMRARTRYGADGARLEPADTEATVLAICRIAAGLAPLTCARVDAFGHGFMPALAGAYYWSASAPLRHWIWHWLRGYRVGSPREGLWNVAQTRRLMRFLDAEAARRRAAGAPWEIVAARIQSPDEDEDDYGDEAEQLDKPGIRPLTWDCEPFGVVVHAQSAGGWIQCRYTVS